ncbi:MAG: hypothetical protein L0211_04060 [Planctomycetaceae bacterium]|nr:hypothetical protein [Planctomycetaceae bacterium]
MSMITMLIVLALIIAKAADPATWAWLASDDQGVVKRPEAKAKAEAPADVAPPPATAVTAKPASETVTAGPTDQEIEEQDGAAEEFMALTDGGIELGKEEMPAYWRLFSWTQHQSTAQLQKRAKREFVFNQFIRDPDEQRGKLFQVELNVRRVIAYDAPENKAGVKKVYEIWGWTTESQAWLYCVLAPELPQGMPQGTNVHERATFTGYFLKVQGYHAAGAAPRDKPLSAPLLIGRLTWSPSALRAARAQSDWDWLAAQARQPGSWLWRAVFAVALVGIIGLGIWLYGVLVPRRAVEAAQSDFETTRKSADVRNWLSSAADGSDEAARWNGSGSRPGKLTDFHDN